MQDVKRRPKLIQVNTVCNGSTGTIMGHIQRKAMDEGFDTLSLYGRRKGYANLPCKKYGNGISFWLHVALTTAFDAQGRGSYFSTKKMVDRIRKEQPDIIHLHNLHGYYLYLSILFKFLRAEYKGKVVWTFHDCWPFTGHCPYFTIAECDRWKVECHNCPNRRKYPISLLWDGSRRNYRWKKKMFTGLDNLTITCPSEWMKEKVEQSFLKDTKCVVVPNGIDFSVFYPHTNDKVISKYGIPTDKKIILGVASIWEERKGLNDFIELAEILPQEYMIVLVGVTDKQMRKIAASNIIGIRRTENQDELAQLYSLATVFMNPSKEESFSLVTIEAMACGTPVIALDYSAPRELVNKDNGVLLSKTGAEDFLEAIRSIETAGLIKEQIVDSVKQFSVDNMTSEMLKLYME